MITQKRLMELVAYNPEDGLFVWWVQRGPRKPGDIVNTVNVQGYIVVRLDYQLYLAHRLAVLYMTGEFPEVTDHINGVTTDNRWVNLRTCTTSENMCNTRARFNSTGYRGVYRDKLKWAARIYKDGQQFSAFGFTTPEAASAWYRRKAEELHGEFSGLRRTMVEGC